MPRGLTIPYICDAHVKDGGSPVFDFDIESGHSTRIYYTDWLNAGVAAYQLLGYPQMDYSNPLKTTITRYLPQQDPDFPWMVATKINSIKGVGARGYYVANGLKAANYLLAEINVSFMMPPYDVIADEYIEDTSEFYRYRTFQGKPAAEYLSVPQSGVLKWSEGPHHNTAIPSRSSVFPGNVGYIVGNIDYNWEWIQVPFEGIPTTTIQNTIGCVNKTAFPVGDGSDAVCAPGTLLLIAWEPVRKSSPYGLWTWNVNYTARYNPRLHNNFYDFSASTPGFYQASVDGTYYTPGSVPDGKLLYNEREFFKLFAPPQP